MKLKSLLMDQKFLAGIGNIYSDEILFGAGLRWDRMSDSLSGEEIRRLYRAMVETLDAQQPFAGRRRTEPRRGRATANQREPSKFANPIALRPGRSPAAPAGDRGRGRARAAQPRCSTVAAGSGR
mgnify:CR=1 FL=1